MEGDPELLAKVAAASRATHEAYERQAELLDVSPLKPGETRMMHPEWPERYKRYREASDEYRRLADEYLGQIGQ